MVIDEIHAACRVEYRPRGEFVHLVGLARMVAVRCAVYQRQAGRQRDVALQGAVARGIVKGDCQRALLARAHGDIVQVELVVDVDVGGRIGAAGLDNLDDDVDVGDVDLAVAVHIGARHGALIVLGALDNSHDHVDVSDIDLAVEVHVAHEPSSIKHELPPLLGFLIAV